MKTDIEIFWVHEGNKHEGFAGFNEASTGCDAYIAFSAWQNESKTASETFDRLDANQLPGGEAELREIWADMVAEAEASEDSRLDVTSSPLM